MLSAVNQERAKRNLQPLVISKELQEGARTWAAHMCNTGNFSHANGFFAENIAMGQETTAEVMRCWMNSGGHRSNILGNYKTVGLSAYTKGGHIYWVQRFR